MPPWQVVLTSWTLNWTALLILVPAALLYAWGIATSRRRGRHRPLWRTLAFYVLGLGSFARAK